MRPRVAAHLLAVAALLLLAAPASADPTPTPSGIPPEAPLRVTVTEILPRAPQPGNAFEVLGVVRNEGTEPVQQVSLRLRVGEVVTTRGGLHEADTDRPLTRQRTSTTVILEAPLAANESARFRIRTDVGSLGLTALGVYPLDVEARGDLGDGPERLGLAPTWVPFFGGGPVQRNRVAVVWPLVDAPRQSVDGTFLDDDLASSLAADGRLGGLLAAARAAEAQTCEGQAHRHDGKADPRPTRCEATPVTYAVDADLLFAAATMAEGYQVRSGAAGDAADGTGKAVAAAWLASLKLGAASSRVVALPWADADVTALARDQAFRDDLARAVVLSANEVRDRLGVEPLASVAWPPSGRQTAEAHDALALTGARAFVLDPSAYGQSENEPARTPSARALLPSSKAGDDLAGLVADTYLSDLVAGDLAEEVGPRLAEQRFLAETAIIAAEAPSVARTLLIAPERRGEVSLAAAANALRDLGRVPWLCPVSLASVADGTEACADRPLQQVPEADDRGPLSENRAGELPQAHLPAVARDRSAASQLTDDVISDRPASQDAVAEMKAELRRAVARAESSAWRGNTAAMSASAGLLHREVQRLLGRVKVYGGQVLLTSTKGTLQVSLQNTLDVPIEVQVLFDDPGEAVLPARTGLIEVTPGNAVPASVRAETQKSGQYVVRAQILDRQGRPFNGEAGRAEVIVRSTGYGRLALAVTTGGAGVLLVAAGVRIVRRALASRAP